VFISRKAAKPILFITCLIPLTLYTFWLLSGALGVNPIEAITRRMGDWALRFLLITLAISPSTKNEVRLLFQLYRLVDAKEASEIVIFLSFYLTR